MPMQTLDLRACKMLTGLPEGISGLAALQVRCDDDMQDCRCMMLLIQIVCCSYPDADINDKAASPCRHWTSANA